MQCPQRIVLSSASFNAARKRKKNIYVTQPNPPVAIEHSTLIKLMFAAFSHFCPFFSFFFEAMRRTSDSRMALR